MNSRPDLETPIDRTASLKQAFEPILDQLSSVESRIRSQAKLFDPAVEDYVAYAIESNGKRLRPALALLAAGATGKITEDHENLAVTVELIHAATLIHDDILDEADKRRSQPTANARWGNALAVLLGDCLFAHSLRLAAAFKDPRMCQRIAQAASEVCSGEIIQTQRRFDLNLNAPDYYKILEMKTGALFAVATELGAMLNGASPETMQELHNFGMKLGTAYQIYDDCLDIAGDEANAGKTLGTDIRRGKLTLPMIHLLETSETEERKRISKLILQGDEAEICALIQHALDIGAVHFTSSTGRRILSEARTSLQTLTPSVYQASLFSLCDTLDSMLAPFSKRP